MFPHCQSGFLFPQTAMNFKRPEGESERRRETESNKEREREWRQPASPTAQDYYGMAAL